MILYEYKCKEHGLFTKLSPLERRKEEKECPKCGQASRYVISTGTIKLEGITGHFPSAASRWERIHENKGNLNKRG